MSSSHAVEPKRRLRFGLRSLLILVGVVASCAWLFSPTRHERAVAAIEEHGGRVEKCGGGCLGRGVWGHVSFADVTFDDVMLQRLAPRFGDLDHFHALDLSNTKVTESGFAEVARRYLGIRLTVCDSQLTPAILDALDDHMYFDDFRFAGPTPSKNRVSALKRQLGLRNDPMENLIANLNSHQTFANRFAVGQCTKLGSQAIRALPALKKLRAQEKDDPAFVAKIDEAIAAVQGRGSARLP